MAHIANWLFLSSVAIEICPPHLTYRLQPLYVSLFNSLATYHSQALGAHTNSLSAYRDGGRLTCSSVQWTRPVSSAAARY
jgi:hypothetical protein